MQFKISIDGTDFSEYCILEDTVIEKEIDGRGNRADIRVRIDGENNPVYGVATYGNAKYGATATVISQLSEVIITDEATGDKLFAGFVTGVVRDQKARDFQMWELQCSGYEYLLQNIVWNASYTQKTDREILQDAFTNALPEITTTVSTVDELLASPIDFESKDLTLLELVEKMAELSGAQWHISEDKELVYKALESISGSFNFDNEAPDNSTTFPFRILRRERFSNQFANKVTVLGSVDPTELVGVAENTASQTELGRVIEAVEVDRDLTTQEAVDLAATVSLNKRAVQDRIVIEYDEKGLNVGDTVSIYDLGVGLNDTYVIQKLSLYNRSTDRTVFEIELGDSEEDLQRLMRQLDRVKTGLKNQPTNELQDGEVTENKIADGAVTLQKIPDSEITNAKIQNLDVGKLTGTTITGKEYLLNAPVGDDSMQIDGTNGFFQTNGSDSVNIFDGQVNLNSGATQVLPDAIFVGSIDLNNDTISTGSAVMTSSGIDGFFINDTHLTDGDLTLNGIQFLGGTRPVIGNFGPGTPTNDEIKSKVDLIVDALAGHNITSG